LRVGGGGGGGAPGAPPPGSAPGALLRNANEINIVPKHFMYNPRKLNVILTQLRCSVCFLNNDLHKSNILSSPGCACGVPVEDAFHIFFECCKYTLVGIC
jgi:hypothetical protein